MKKSKKIAAALTAFLSLFAACPDAPQYLAPFCAVAHAENEVAPPVIETDSSGYAYKSTTLWNIPCNPTSSTGRNEWVKAIPPSPTKTILPITGNHGLSKNMLAESSTAHSIRAFPYRFMPIILKKD